MQSLLFEKTNDDGVTEYAYVFAGTDSWEDAVDDITQLIGISRQIAHAVNNARTLTSELGQSELTFIGHSLGAMLATASSIATEKAAITFNPAVISSMTKLLHGLYGTPDVTNYISSVKSIFGGYISVDPITNIQRRLGLIAPGVNIPVPVCYPISHSIDTIVKSLAPKQ